MGVLNERERRIFEARRLAEDPITLEELSSEFGVSRERVRQIEVRAFEKVQKAVQEGRQGTRGAPRPDRGRRGLAPRIRAHGPGRAVQVWTGKQHLGLPAPGSPPSR